MSFVYEKVFKDQSHGGEKWVWLVECIFGLERRVFLTCKLLWIWCNTRDYVWAFHLGNLFLLILLRKGFEYLQVFCREDEHLWLASSYNFGLPYGTTSGPFAQIVFFFQFSYENGLKWFELRMVWSDLRVIEMHTSKCKHAKRKELIIRRPKSKPCDWNKSNSL